MKRDPRDVILPFFKRLEEKPHLDGFLTAVDDFTSRIVKRGIFILHRVYVIFIKLYFDSSRTAIEKRKEMDEEREAEMGIPSREERLGPGGLDPVEV